MLPLPDNFRYLNRENRWLDFHWSGLGLSSDGALQLLSSPATTGVPPDMSGLASPAAPAGIAVDASGRIFYTDPDQNLIYASGGCSSGLTKLTCVTESSGLPPLRNPRGLLILDDPARLVVVDSGNHRILFLDLNTLTIRDVWGPEDAAEVPAPGLFNTPWTISADGDDNLYVLDYGHRLVRKFRRTGEADTSFENRLQTSGLVPHPGALTVVGEGADAQVFVFDIDRQTIQVFDAEGAPLGTIRYPGMTLVTALVAGATVLYAGDNNLRRILCFERAPGFPFAGDAAGYDGPTVALACPEIVALPSATVGPVQLAPGKAFLPFGVLWSDAIASGTSPAVWNRLRTYRQDAPGAHVEFYYSISNSSTTPTVDTNAADPFSDPRWIPLPNDVEDFLLGGDKANFLFTGAIFRGDRTATVRLTQMRADFNVAGYLPYLPAIYREPASTADFLRRFVALFQGIFDDVEGEMDTLVRYFNPDSAPAEALPWLASWLAVEVDQGEPLARIRAAIAGAFRRYRWRGTAEGLRLALLEDAGVHANIVQPISEASFWGFPADTRCSGVPSTLVTPQLGGTTHLPSMQPGGAVLGSTAVLDHSYLIQDDQFGEPLFDGAADQFIVEVYRAEVNSPARLELVRTIVEREKPAHTMWRLSILDASMRVGFQARTGIDAIVGGTPGPSGLGVAGDAGGLRLSGAASPRAGEIRLGRDLRLE